MKALTRYTSPHLLWQKVEGPQPSFTLSMGEDLVATLTFLPAGETLAQLDTADGSWTLKQRGFPAETITLREIHSRVNLAILHRHALGHGKLVFLSGDAYAWVHLKGLEQGGAFLSSDGLPLVHTRTIQPHLHTGLREDAATAEVEVGHCPHSHATPLLLAGISWYLLQLDAQVDKGELAAEMSLRM